MKANRGLTIERMVELGRVSRSGFYRFDNSAEARPDCHMNLRDAIQRIALEWPSYGRPRITAQLRRQGWTVNPKLVYRLMREDNLLCVRKRRFVVTTDSNHPRKVYPNLAPNLILTATDQLWRADITYIRLRDEFVFLAVILDAYSRRVIGWALDRNMEEELTLTALRMALSRRAVPAGLVHHSDRGSQYASNDYTDLLKANGIDISMSRKGNPWDNAACESFMKTLKYEEVLRNEYRDLAEARACIAEFLEKVYNQKRLHSEQAVAITIKHCKERRAFGKTLLEFQNTRFKLAECQAQAHIMRVFLDNCMERLIAGKLDTPTAAMAKYWLTERECAIIDECVQLHGGYGYMMEYPITRMWADSRVQRIYAGTNEIMKELIARSFEHLAPPCSPPAYLPRTLDRDPLTSGWGSFCLGTQGNWSTLTLTTTLGSA